jgi:hypothetical protein
MSSRRRRCRAPERDRIQALGNGICRKAEQRQSRCLGRVEVTIDVRDVAALIQVPIDFWRSIGERLNEREVRRPVPPVIGEPRARGERDEN